MDIKDMTFDWDELHNRSGYLTVTREGNLILLAFHDKHSKITYVLNESYQPIDEEKLKEQRS